MPKKRRAKSRKLFSLGFDSPGCGMGDPGRKRGTKSLMRGYRPFLPGRRRLSGVGSTLTDLIQIGDPGRKRKRSRKPSRPSFLPMRYGFGRGRFAGLGSFPSFVGLGDRAFAIAPAKALFSSVGLKKVGGVGIGLVFGDLLGSVAQKYLKITGTAGNFLGGILGAIAGYEFSARVLKQYDIAEGALYGALAPALVPFVGKVTAPVKKAIKLQGFSGLDQISLPETTRVMGVDQIRLPGNVKVAGGTSVMGVDEEVLTEEELGEDEGIM